VPRPLTPTEIHLLTDIVERRGDDSSLLEALSRGQMSNEEGRSLGDLVTEELAATGFDDNYDPTPYGRTLEDLIDALADA
jgi:hypothetical protein